MLITSVAGTGVAAASSAMIGRASVALWQTQDAVVLGNSHLITIFLGIIAFGMLLHGLLIAGLIVGGLVAKKAISDEVAELKAKVLPIVAKSQTLIAEITEITADLKPKIAEITSDLKPKIADISTKIDAITGHVEEISTLVKDKIAEFGPTISAANATVASANQTLLDANAKTHQQLLRLNDMVTSTLDATAQMGKSIRHGITQPGREVAGIVSGVKAAVQTLIETKPKPRASTRTAQPPYAATTETPYATAAARSGKDEFDF